MRQHSQSCPYVSKEEMVVVLPRSEGGLSHPLYQCSGQINVTLGLDAMDKCFEVKHFIQSKRDLKEMIENARIASRSYLDIQTCPRNVFLRGYFPRGEVCTVGYSCLSLLRSRAGCLTTATSELSFDIL